MDGRASGDVRRHFPSFSRRPELVDGGGAPGMGHGRSGAVRGDRGRTGHGPRAAGGVARRPAPEPGGLGAVRRGRIREPDGDDPGRHVAARMTATNDQLHASG